MSVRRVMTTLIAASVAGSVLLATTGTATAVTVTKKTIAPGLTYRRITDPAGPWIVHVLTVAPAKPVSLDPVAAGPVGSWARTSTIASRVGALAAINGDYPVWPGFPMHGFVQDGKIDLLRDPPGISFAVRRDETKASVARAPMTSWAKDMALGKGLGVAAWNSGAPGTNQVVGFTGYGGTKMKPPSNACSVRLRPDGTNHWNPQQDGVYRDFVIDARACQTSAMTVTTGTTVLSSKLSGAGATWIKALKVGGTVRLSWHDGIAGVLDVIGGNPMLVEDGQIVAPDASCTEYLCRRHPRSAVGVTATNKVLMVVVDGRKSTSVGMRLDELARYMKSLGAVSAMNFDGGGSATMWIKGMGVVNAPTDSSGERSVTNALVVLPGADPGETEPKARAVPFGARSTVEEKLVAIDEAGRRSADLAAADPASTGGLLDWLLATGRVDRRSLPPALARAADRFRATR
jgi:hypothetical protein